MFLVIGFMLLSNGFIVEDENVEESVEKKDDIGMDGDRVK